MERADLAATAVGLANQFKSSEDLAKQMEKDIKLKIRLLCDGIRVDDSSLEGVGTIYKEQAKWLFEWDHVSTTREVPEEIFLTSGVCVGVREDPRSHLILKGEDERRYIEEFGQIISDVYYIERPNYYSKQTSDGAAMHSVCALRGTDCFVYNFSPACCYHLHGGACHYCSINYTADTYKNTRLLHSKSESQLRETFEEALKDNVIRHIMIIGGMHPKELELILMGMRVFKEVLGTDSIPAIINHTAPKDWKVLDILREEGAVGVSYNIEIWQRDYFKAICPGKERAQSQEHWIATAEKAVEIFGRGGSVSFFVAGIEPLEYLMDGIEYLTSKGVNTQGVTWSVARGSKFRNHRTPHPEYYLELMNHTADCWEKYGLVETMDAAKDCNTCIECNFTTLIANEIYRRKLTRQGNNVRPTIAPIVKRKNI